MQNKKHARESHNRVFPSKKFYILLMIVLGLAGIAFLSALILIDTLPSDLTIILIVVMVGLLVLASILMGREKRFLRIIGVLIAAVFLTVFGSLTYYMSNTYAMLNTISKGSLDATGPSSKPVSVTEEPFNIYLTGIDQWEEEKGYDLERSDVNMIITVNPVTKEVLLTSIPRDSYVKLHTAQEMDKLTHTGIYGVDETLNTVQDWLGIDLNYYVKMNFSAAQDVINAVGGIKVYSPVAFESSLKGYKYEKGWNKLSGKTALYFARERKAFEGKDYIRVENQQRVMEAVIKKMTSSTALLTHYGDIMKAAKSNLQTNMSSEEMLSLAKMQISELSEWDVKAQKIEGEGGQEHVASLSSRNKYDVFITDEESVKKCVDGINGILNPSMDKIEKANEQKRKSFVINLVNTIRNKIEEKSNLMGEAQ